MGKERTAGLGVKTGEDRIEDPESVEGAVKSDRTEPSKPRPAPPAPEPKAPKPESEDTDEAPAPDFGKNPESEAAEVENADPGATVGSNRRPGSPSNPAEGVARRSGVPVGTELVPSRAAEDDEDDEKPSPRPEPGRDGAPLNVNVPEDSPAGDGLNQFL